VGRTRARRRPKGGARPLQAPGSYWEYNDVRINQLSLALLHLFRRPLETVFREAILQPLGAQDAFRWEAYDDARRDACDGRRLPSVPGGTHWGGGCPSARATRPAWASCCWTAAATRARELLPPGWVRRMGHALRHARPSTAGWSG
jgi:CubicO group peptidase (beta-lactamase class C family)